MPTVWNCTQKIEFHNVTFNYYQIFNVQAISMKITINQLQAKSHTKSLLLHTNDTCTTILGMSLLWHTKCQYKIVNISKQT